MRVYRYGCYSVTRDDDNVTRIHWRLKKSIRVGCFFGAQTSDSWRVIIAAVTSLSSCGRFFLMAKALACLRHLPTSRKLISSSCSGSSSESSSGSGSGSSGAGFNTSSSQVFDKGLEVSRLSSILAKSTSAVVPRTGSNSVSSPTRSGRATRGLDSLKPHLAKHFWMVEVCSVSQA